MDEPLQKTLERYDVLDRIAVGGMAEVFLAKAYGAHGFEKTLAIKKILPELARDAEFEARFIAEAKVAVRLSHANVVQVFDFGRIGESLFIAMEYVDGLDLAALLRKLKDEQRQVPLPAAFHIAIEIVRALDFAHQHGVVHRDVSPSNILISRAGEVKIGDFGIAVAAQPHKAAGPGARKVMGKWRYMSPEQTRGDTLDTRSDLFSAAVVLFELFTGEKLFPGDEAEDIIANIEKMAIPRASEKRVGLPSRLDEILAGPLARKPIDRPARPAVVLRSLIELSYESSIMATALDVAETIASVLPARPPSGPGMHLDEVIRKQLGQAQAEKSVARKTAVTDGKPPSTQTLERDQTASAGGAGGRAGEHSTGLFRKIGDDGVSRLEEIPPDERPGPDSGLHKLLDAHFDPDRRTEVGGPPTGQVPKAEATAGAPKAGGTTYTGSRSSRGLVIGIAAAALAAGAIGGWSLLREKNVTTPAIADAATIAEGEIDIYSDPEGATGKVVSTDGTKTIEHTPSSVKHLTVNSKVHIHLEHPGYRPFDDDLTVTPDKMHYAPRLQKLRAVLHVVTTPAGAQVELGTRVLGETPFTRDDLEPATGAELVITHAGYDTQKTTVDLVAGETREVKLELKEAQRYGWISLAVTNGWGEVYFKGTKIGRAPVPRLRLPVGRQTLHLQNPPAHKAWDVVCEVDEHDITPCSTSLP
ncbi:MAG TPA: serine/threonine-protein kinase [Kofleriaceae bacterium]|nr:serine/threonine-protein kinase [Kofleriaceae bacterium]